MELSDFTSLLAALFIVGLPLAAIYSILGRIGWISRKGLMSDAFVIWIVWLISGVTACIPIAILDLKARLLIRGMEVLSIPLLIAFIVSSVSVFFVMRRLSNSRSGVTEILSVDTSNRGKVSLRNAFMISGGAAFTLAVAIGAVTLSNAGYTYLFPPKDNPFRIYD